MLAYFVAHRFSNNHMEQLRQDSVCGCFHCEKIFHPGQITDWIIADNDCDALGTARCPYCGVDAVIGESSGFPITPEFLNGMAHHWFGRPEKLKKNPLRMDQYLPQIRPLINALWDYANDEMSWDELRTLLSEKQDQPAFGVKLESYSAGWACYTPVETLYATEFALMRQILCSDPAEARSAVEAFFRSEPEMSPVRIYLLSRRKSGAYPVFMQGMIGPLYGYLIGKVPQEAVCYRLNHAQECWETHEHRDILEENFLPGYELMCELLSAVQRTTFGDPDSEESFRKIILSAMEAFVRNPSKPNVYML